VIYNIRHLTAYANASSVASVKLALRVTPRDEAGQKTTAHALNIAPLPKSVTVEHDFYGNAVNIVIIDTPHKDLKIEATSTVEVSHDPIPQIAGMEWEKVAEAALSERDLSATAPAHFLFASPQVKLSAAVTRYVQESFSKGRGILEASRELIRRIKSEFKFESEVTDISTPLAQAFDERHGVCQDFAHIMIAGLRGLGLPAAYVSGYIRTIPPPGKKRLEGADATHAWVSVWCGSAVGWVGFDPTNAIEAANDHIVLAIGRDFSDVSPVYGVFVGSGASKLEVKVDVIPATSP
jgi:transglutaminase-like putative cysteine protease